MSAIDQPQVTTILPTLAPSQKHRGMSIGEAFRIALQGLLSNPMRSILTMLGIIIGVGSVIVMIALGSGAAKATEDTIKKLGTNVLTVMPNSQMRGGVSQGLGSQQTMKFEDAEALEKLCPSVKYAIPEYRGQGTVKFQNQNTKTTIYGATPPYFEVRNLPIKDGKAFTQNDVKNKAKVAIIGDSIRETLFGGIQPVGKQIKVNGQSFKVIGVLEKRGGMMFRNPDDQVTVPITTAMIRVFGVDYIGSMSVQATSADKMIAVQDEIKAAITKAHRLRPGEDPDIRIFSQGDLMESAQATSGFLTSLLAGIAIVSLVVGGIGIMNIMLVTVTERTREIGIRKAIGARRRDILYQFLIESVTLSLVGGLIGIGLGIGLSQWMAKPQDEGGMGYPMILTMWPVLMSFGSSAVVGVFFGIYPAVKASRLDPIEALRYE
jgi:putative ABC transport system permease protein